MMAQESSDHSRTSSTCDLFDSLCSEVLGEIFVTCTLRDTYYGEGTNPSLSSAPINVSQVCRRWRQVALSTPRLWSYFFLKLWNVDSDSSSDSRYVRRVIPVIKTWIGRSSIAPLDFEIYLSPGNFAEETVEEIESLLRILIEQRERWRSVSINYKFRFTKWFDVTFSNMHMLQKLDLVCCSARVCVARLDFSRSPELRSLSLEGHIKIVDRSVIPSLTNISITSNTYGVFDTAVSVQYAFPTFHDCFNILRMAPSLQTLFAKLVGSSERGTFEHIKMDKLRWIRLQLGSTPSQATSKHFAASTGQNSQTCACTVPKW
ncbi:hypothetical protein SCHPADRAFT_593109 [Schizopora paradoxa]|uniref:Uncharacterized protein n=1 Tax=Schizopora paradoxa TaxID=27342 RepID=A0A0H2RH23_9AGAM|nr:hypothetical protein SCHPADRAFT_593109 [Schizopora paradoxa]